MIRSRPGFTTRTALTIALALGWVIRAGAITIDWVAVGDPGNAAHSSGYGAVPESFQIMTYEFTNRMYAEFLNSVAASDPYALYDSLMGSDPRGGITRTGTSGAYVYAVKTNMADKPVPFTSWLRAARVANWLHNGATPSSSTETGAYTLNGMASGTAPALNPGARYSLPTENQWFKAAYYKGSGTNAGYWSYATQSNTAPTPVTSGSTGIGSAGSTGNFANYRGLAVWNGDFNFTTVGTNGGPSAYGAFDLTGNLWEWFSLSGSSSTTVGRRGGCFANTIASDVSSSLRLVASPTTTDVTIGFRLAAVPEPSTCAAALAGLGCGMCVVAKRRKRR